MKTTEEFFGKARKIAKALDLMSDKGYEDHPITGNEPTYEDRMRKPVAWTACLDCGKRVTGDSIHTCSPQLKTLTDEEIKDFTVKIYNCRTGAEAHEIVLAILKKAQEK